MRSRNTVYNRWPGLNVLVPVPEEKFYQVPIVVISFPTAGRRSQGKEGIRVHAKKYDLGPGNTNTRENETHAERIDDDDVVASSSIFHGTRRNANIHGSFVAFACSQLCVDTR